MTPEERIGRIEDIFHWGGEEIEKQNEGIGSLIVVARTSLDSIKELREDPGPEHSRRLWYSTAANPSLLRAFLKSFSRSTN